MSCSCNMRRHLQTHTNTDTLWGKISPVACNEQHSKAAVPLQLKHPLPSFHLPPALLLAAITSCKLSSSWRLAVILTSQLSLALLATCKRGARAWDCQPTRTCTCTADWLMAKAGEKNTRKKVAWLLQRDDIVYISTIYYILLPYIQLCIFCIYNIIYTIYQAYIRKTDAQSINKRRSYQRIKRLILYF